MILRLLLAVVLGVSFAGCGSPGPEKSVSTLKTAGNSKAAQPSDKTEVEIRPRQIFWENEAGKPILKAEVKKALASHSGQDMIAEFQGVKAVLYKNGTEASTLIAPKVIADSRTKEVRASGGVKVTSSNGSVMECERLTWKSKEGKIYGTGNVKFVSRNMTTTSGRFVSDTAMKHRRFED